LQIEIRPGTLYFLKGNEEARPRELTAGLIAAGYRLLVVSPRPLGAIRDDFEVGNDCILTLTDSVGQNCLGPENLAVLTDTITKFIEGKGPSAFLIEDLGLLKQKSEFPKVLRLVGFLYEALALNRGIGIILIDPQSWEGTELAFLGKEGSMVDEKDHLETKTLQSKIGKNTPAQNV
jgi:hypothetical protein